MEIQIETAAEQFDALSAAILALTGDDRPFNRIWGWSAPPLTRQELAEIPARTASALHAVSAPALSTGALSVIREAPQRVRWMIDNAIPNMPGGNGTNVLAVVRELTKFVEDEREQG